MAHVRLVDRPRGIVGRYAFRYSRKTFGSVVEPTQAAAHHNGVLMAWGALEMGAARGWKKLDPSLAGLVVQLASVRIGCPWCVDYGYFENVQKGTDPRKVRAVANWRESTLFDERDRTAFEYVDAATSTPASVSDDLAARLHRFFDDEQIVELASWVALENYRSRFNAGLGLKSQGFSDNCDVPQARERVRKDVARSA